MYVVVSQFNSSAFSLAVTQLQTTLAAVQELLIQQQQKIQELTQELAASKVPTSNFSPLEHHQFQSTHGFFFGHMEGTYWVDSPATSSAISPVSLHLTSSWVVWLEHWVWAGYSPKYIWFWRGLYCVVLDEARVSEASDLFPALHLVLHLRWNYCGVSPLTKRGKGSCAENLFSYVICNFTHLYFSCTLYILLSQAYTWKTLFKSLVHIQVMAKQSYYLGSCFNDFDQLSVTGGLITALLTTHSDPFPLTLDSTLAIKPSVLTSLCCYMCK